MLYLASRNPLPEILSPDWQLLDFDAQDWASKAPRLVVSCLSETNCGVDTQFIERNVVNAGSYEGCGCGFNYCTDNAVTEASDLVADKFAPVAMESRVALADYVEQNGVSSIFGCWAGDEILTKVAEVEVSLAQLRDVAFPLPERVLMRIKRMRV